MTWGVERMTCAATTGREGSRVRWGVVAGGGGEVGGRRRRAREGGVARAMAQKGQDGSSRSISSLVVVVVVVDKGIGASRRVAGTGRWEWRRACMY